MKRFYLHQIISGEFCGLGVYTNMQHIIGDPRALAFCTEGLESKRMKNDLVTQMNGKYLYLLGVSQRQDLILSSKIFFQYLCVIILNGEWPNSCYVDYQTFALM